MGRWIVPGLFLAVAVAIGAHGWQDGAFALAHPSLHAGLVALYYVLRTAVALAFAAFTVGRGEPHRRARGVLAFGACAVAMGSVLAFSAPSATTAAGFVLVGDLVAVVSCVWLLTAVLALGRCFGVLPEARGLVTRGPYRFTRHPVYLGEIGACVGLSLAAPSALNVAVLALFLAAQAVRMRLEERALTVAFADYAGYAARTPRLVPRITRARSKHRPVTTLVDSIASARLTSPSN